MILDTDYITENGKPVMGVQKGKWRIQDRV